MPGAQANGTAQASSTPESPAEAATKGADLARYERPSVTVDVVILTIRSGRLEVLLVQRGRPPFEGMWAIPGGFVNPDETLEVAAQRELEEETGVHGFAVQQFQTFGDPGRDPRGWVISVAHLALVAWETLREQRVQGADDAAQANWFAAYAPPPLAFDHAKILTSALAHLAGTLDCSPVARPLLPAAFSLRTLRSVYAVLLNHPPQAATFRKRIRVSGLLEIAPVSGQASGRAGQTLYRFSGHPAV